MILKHNIECLRFHVVPIFRCLVELTIFESNQIKSNQPNETKPSKRNQIIQTIQTAQKHYSASTMRLFYFSLAFLQAMAPLPAEGQADGQDCSGDRNNFRAPDSTGVW
jgi:hypothetical protein